MDQEPNNKKQLLTTLAVLIVIVVIVGGVILVSRSDKSDEMNSTSQQSTSDTATDSTMDDASSGTYKDGSYTATGSYVSPGGQEDITITVTLEDGVVTGTSAKSGAREAEGREFQGQFIGGYKSQVVGKNIDDISLSHVSGSSLTSQGFNDALEKIKDQAQA